MDRRKGYGARIGAMICVVLLTLSTFCLFGIAESQENYGGKLDDIDVLFDTSTHPKVTLYKGSDYLYSIGYKELDTPNGKVPLNVSGWDIDTTKISDGRFPHMRFKLDREISNPTLTADLSLTINVISISDTSEVTFSFSLDNIEGLPSGKIFIIQEINTKGQIVRIPGQAETGKGTIEYYEFSFSNGHTGFYSWNLEAKMNGNTSEAIFFSSEGGGLFLGSDYDASADHLSISSMELDKTRMSAVVPVPETYSHFPSFVIGLLIASSFVIGVVIEKRREFYRDRDSSSIVRLEDSSYYKGEE